MSDLLLYGAIGWEVDALETVRAISEAKGKKLSVRINSPGGGVWDGLAIRDAIRSHGSADTYVNGLAASMGSVIFLAGNKRTMAEGSRLMIHNPWSGAVGNASDLRKEADVLDGIGEDMAKTYSEATGGKVSVERAREMMDAETWLTPDEAVALGFAHGIEGKAAAFAKIPESMHFKNRPKEVDQVSTETTEPNLLDRMLAKVTGTEQIRADLTRAESALTEAVAKIGALEARAIAAESALSDAQAAHAAALTEAVAAAKIEGAQEFAVQNLQASAPHALPHLEESTEAFTTHSAKWEALRASGDFKAAGEYLRNHSDLIAEGK